ncbi:hypothetical protein PENTCL1PPCAC_19883, partial [Pristionchus entomophagus]
DTPATSRKEHADDPDLDDEFLRFKVEWRGFPEEENWTIEPLKNLQSEEGKNCIQKFLKKHNEKAEMTRKNESDLDDRPYNPDEYEKGRKRNRKRMKKNDSNSSRNEEKKQEISHIRLSSHHARDDDSIGSNRLTREEWTEIERKRKFAKDLRRGRSAVDLRERSKLEELSKVNEATVSSSESDSDEESEENDEDEGMRVEPPMDSDI